MEEEKPHLVLLDLMPRGSDGIELMNRILKTTDTPEFARTRRRSLFLGLSDGARIDEFRRSNRDLSNEQVYATYEVAGPRLAEMRSQLPNDQKEDPSDPIQFELVFLLDDFAGSGKSILRERNGTFGGRLQRFSELLRMDAQEEASVFSGPQTEIHICLYVATQQAVDQLTQSIEDSTASAPWEHAPVVHAVQLLDQNLRIEPSRDSRFCQLLDVGRPPDKQGQLSVSSRRDTTSIGQRVRENPRVQRRLEILRDTFPTVPTDRPGNTDPFGGRDCGQDT